MHTFSRRDLLKMSALAAAALPFAELPGFSTPQTAAGTDPWKGLKIGVATYTVRELPIEEAIKGIQRVGLKYVSIKNVKNHVDLSHTPEERKARAKMFRDAGLIPLSVGKRRDEKRRSDMRRAFEYARDVGVSTMVCSPSGPVDDLNLWIKRLDPLVKEFNIKLAIHNHGLKTKTFPRLTTSGKSLKNTISALACALTLATPRARTLTRRNPSSNAKRGFTMFT